MAKSNKVLSIDINNESVTIVEITASQKKQTYIHKVLIFETPEDSFDDGMIKNPSSLAAKIKEELQNNGVNNKNAIFVMNSTKIVNREVVIPYVKSNKVGEMINANANDYFPVSNIEDYVISNTVLEDFTDENGAKQLRVMAVAAPQGMVAGYYELASAAGLKCEALDYAGNAMLQLIKTQTAEQSTTMVIQLGSDSTVLNVVHGDKLLLQRTVPYGTNPCVNAVMEERGCEPTEAMAILQNDRVITADFDDNEPTNALRYLINNIGRVMDFYASKNPNLPIENVFLTGDGALIKGIDGLFKVQLNVSSRIMDSLYNVKFDPAIDLKLYSPVYLIAPIGAAFAPMGFGMPGKGGTSSGNDSIAPFVAIAAVLLLAAGAIIGFFTYKRNAAETARDDMQAKVDSLQYINDVIAEHDAAQAKAEDIQSMSASTYELNEQMLDLINDLEDKSPTGVVVSSIKADATKIEIPCVADNYEQIADYIINLKTIDCIDDVYVSEVGKEESMSTGENVLHFNLECVYTNPNATATDASETDDAVTVE